MTCLGLGTLQFDLIEASPLCPVLVAVDDTSLETISEQTSFYRHRPLSVKDGMTGMKAVKPVQIDSSHILQEADMLTCSLANQPSDNNNNNRKENSVFCAPLMSQSFESPKSGPIVLISFISQR